MLKIDYQMTLGIILLIIFIISLIAVLIYVNPLIEKKHPRYDKTELQVKYGFYMPNITCPNCDSDNLTPYAYDINTDNHNKKIITFFYCNNCSTIFSVRLH